MARSCCCRSCVGSAGRGWRATSRVRAPLLCEDGGAEDGLAADAGAAELARLLTRLRLRLLDPRLEYSDGSCGREDDDVPLSGSGGGDHLKKNRREILTLLNDKKRTITINFSKNVQISATVQVKFSGMCCSQDSV